MVFRKMDEREFEDWMWARELTERHKDSMDAWLMTVGWFAFLIYAAWVYFREGTI